MNVLQVIPGFEFGGAETMCQNLSIELRNMGHNVLVVSLYNVHSSISEKIESNGIKIIYLNKKRGLDLKVVWTLRKIIHDFKPDIIHSHLYAIKYCVLSDLFFRHKRIHTLHSIAQNESSRGGILLNHIFFRLNKVVPVALSEYNKKTVIDVYRLKEERIPIVFNGVNLNRCIQKKSYAFGDRIQIIHVGRLMPVKNHVEMIKACVSLHKIDKRVHFLFVGDGYLRDELEALVTQNNANDFIEFYGLSNDIFTLLADADIFILPSLYEGIPMTIIEAMGSALPIVASNVGGIPDMIMDKKEGILCAPTAESICSKLQKLIDDEELRAMCGKNAYNKSFVFSSENMANSYLNIYSRA